MAWVRIDDKLRQHPKWLQLRKTPDAKLLWIECLVACNEATTDGLVAGYVLDQWAFAAGIPTPRKVAAAAARLVEVGLWHDHETIGSCEDCSDVRPTLDADSYYVHAYLEYQPTEDEVKDPLERRRARRRKQLIRDTALTTAIRARDADCCRYCGQAVNFKARSGDLSGTYDHVDPADFGSNAQGDKDGGNAAHKVVVACRRCNGIKKDRTPDEAHMPLLRRPRAFDPATGELIADPAPHAEDPAPALAAPDPALAAPGRDLAPAKPDPGPGQDNPRTHEGARAPARETGPGRDGPGRGQAGSGSGRAGSGRGGRRAGPGKAGGGPSRGGSPAPPPPDTESSTRPDPGSTS